LGFAQGKQVIALRLRWLAGMGMPALQNGKRRGRRRTPACVIGEAGGGHGLVRLRRECPPNRGQETLRLGSG